MDINTYLEGFYKIESDLIEGRRAQQIVSWDWRVMTPKAAGKARSQTIAFLSALNHELLTSPNTVKVLDYLSQPEVSQKLDGQVAARVRLLKRDSDRSTKIPADLFKEFSILQGESESVWEKAKRTNDWPLYMPYLKHMFDYTNRFIDLWGYEGSRYNALLGYEEEGMTAEKLEVLFNDIRDGITPLVAKVAASGVEIDDSFCRQPYPVDKQRELSHELLKLVGFNIECGVLGESEHPYTSSFGHQDVRLTTHYYENMFLPAVFSTLHEAGHGMYEQNTAPELGGTVAGRGLHGGMHESVSRFWENMVGRSKGFWQCNMDLFKRIFPEQLGDISPEQMYRAVNKSGRSLTRIESDELTYNLHIILRVELERDVFEGRAQVADLPGLWTEKMQQYLGLTPPNDSLGILQDIQWSMAQFGYFPSYTLGNLYNAQYTAAIRKELDFDGLVTQGKYNVISDWMRAHLYKYGSLRTPVETITALSGEEINAKYLVNHLTNKFSELYHLN